MQKEMVDYRHSFKDFDAGLNLLSSAMKGSLGGAGVAIAGIQGGKGVLDSTARERSSQESLGDKMSDLVEFEKKHGAKNLKLARWKKFADQKKVLEDARDKAAESHDKAKSGFLFQMGQQKMGGKTLADRLGGIAEFLKKHKLGVFLALGSMVVLGAIVKKALDSSPMFGQMLKLWKFAIMMIFRPLGDFFGFFFRPILVLLLRKFIIPWYTTMYPVMVKLGHDLGTFVASAMDWFLKIGTWFSGLFGGGDFDLGVFLTALFSGGVGYAKDIVNYFTTDFFPQVFRGVDLAGTIVNFFTNSILPAAFGSTGNVTLSSAWDKFVAIAQSIFTSFPTEIQKIMNSILNNIPSIDEAIHWFSTKLMPNFREIWDKIVDVHMPFILSALEILKGIFRTGVDQFYKYFGTDGEFDQIFAEGKKQFFKFFGEGGWIDGLMANVAGITDDIEILMDKFTNKIMPKVEELLVELGKIIEDPLGYLSHKYIGQHFESQVQSNPYSPSIHPWEDMPQGDTYGDIDVTIHIQNMSGTQESILGLEKGLLSALQEARAKGGKI
jgi:hypothetical protein